MAKLEICLTGGNGGVSKEQGGESELSPKELLGLVQLMREGGRNPSRLVSCRLH